MAEVTHLLVSPFLGSGVGQASIAASSGINAPSVIEARSPATQPPMDLPGESSVGRVT